MCTYVRLCLRASHVLKSKAKGHLGIGKHTCRHYIGGGQSLYKGGQTLDKGGQTAYEKGTDGILGGTNTN